MAEFDAKHRDFGVILAEKHPEVVFINNSQVNPVGNYL